MTQARDVADGKFTNTTLTIDSGSDNANTLLLSDGAADANIVDGFVTSRHHSSSEEPVLMIQGRSTSSENIVLIGGTHNNSTYNTATSIKFFTASGYTNTTPVERMRVLSGGGLTFNGDTAAANALDDYEEGTWTPDLQDAGQDSYTGAYAAQLGKYTKVGNMVTVWAQINASNTLNTHGCTGSESVRVAGLPFTALNDSGAASYTGSATNINSINFPSGYTMLSPSIGKGGSHINLKLAGDNVSDRSLTCTEYQSGEIFLCVNYRAT